MSIPRIRVVSCLLAIAVVALAAQQAWAIYFALAPSKDEWGLKYDVEVEDAGNDMVIVKFTLLDEGRLKPVHSVSLSVLDKARSTASSRLSRVKGKLAFTTTPDGKRVGQIKIHKDEVDLAALQVLTQRVDGKFQSKGAAYYDISLAKYLEKANTPALAAPISPEGGSVKK